MKISKNLQIERAASTDATRYILAEPYLKGNRLVATDGRLLVVIPVERDDGDMDGHVTAAALSTARKVGHKNGEAQIKCGDVYTLSNGATLPRNAELSKATYPNFEQVIPKDTAMRKKITLSVRYLTDAAKALGAKKITLEIAGEKDPVIIRACPTQGAFAVLMPSYTP